MKNSNSNESILKFENEANEANVTTSISEFDSQNKPEIIFK